MENYQDGLNDLVSQKINQKIQRGTENATQAFERMLREGNMAKDFIAPMGTVVRNGKMPVSMTFEGNGSLKMNLSPDLPQVIKGEIPGSLSIHNNALTQITERLNVPLKYTNELNRSEWGRMLLATILNTHSLNSNRERALIRSVGSEVRAVLSDHYRRLNGEKIMRAFLNEVNYRGGVLCDGYMTDTKIWVEKILPDPIRIETVKNGVVFICFGARLSTSDYGDGALDVRSFIMQGVCLNGMVSNSILRAVHLGQKLEDNIIYSERTYNRDTDLQVSKIRDVTAQVFNPRFIQERSEKIQAASSIEVDLKRELGNLNKALISKEEAEEVLTVITNNKREDGVGGENTIFKLAQGLAAIARMKSPDRKKELQEISGALVENVSIK